MKKSVLLILSVLLVKNNCKSIIDGLTRKAAMPRKAEAREIIQIEKQFTKVDYKYIPRDENVIADSLSRIAQYLTPGEPSYDLSKIEGKYLTKLQLQICSWALGEEVAVKQHKQGYVLFGRAVKTCLQVRKLVCRFVIGPHYICLVNLETSWKNYEEPSEEAVGVNSVTREVKSRQLAEKKAPGTKVIPSNSRSHTFIDDTLCS